jgi:hypothetical protein
MHPDAEAKISAAKAALSNGCGGPTFSQARPQRDLNFSIIYTCASVKAMSKMEN